MLCLSAAISNYANEKPDSCYIYGYLRWEPTSTKYVAKIELGPGKKSADIIDADGTKIFFQSFLNALNYMSSKGWEVMEISKKNPDNNTFTLEQYAIIRKKMGLDEASPYISPKDK